MHGALTYSIPILRAAYEMFVWKNGAGLDSTSALPFVRWLVLKDSFRLNLYTIGFFPSTTIPVF